jgi:hypothetical protein
MKQTQPGFRFPTISSVLEAYGFGKSNLDSGETVKVL